MTETMTKLLACGMELRDIVAKSTWAPAQQIRQPELGHISVAAEADVAVLKVEEGDFGLTDNGNTGNRVRRASRRITCQLTVKGGSIAWDANGLTHDDWTGTPPADGTLP
jgi:dihydroorotase